MEQPVLNRIARSARLRTAVTESVARWLLRLALYAALLSPIAALGVYAFSTRWFYPQLLPAEWTAEPLLRQLLSRPTRAALGSSLAISAMVTVLALVLALPAARVIGLRRFAGRAPVLLLLFLPTAVPPLATGIGLNIVFLRLGLAGSPLGVILVHLVPVLPYCVFALLGVFARFDERYEQQARTLGASPGRVLLRVTLPLAGLGIAVAALLAFLVSWSQYVLTLLIGGGRVITLPMLLFAAVAGGNPSTTAALALLFAVPPIVAIAVAARVLSAGSLAGGQQN